MSLTHSFFKQIYRYTRARSHRHSEKIWPYMQVTRSPNGALATVAYRGQQVTALDIHALQPSSEDLLIVASGPSIQQLDLSPLQSADWMLVNGAVNVLAAYPQQAARFYVVVDQGFITDRLDVVSEMLAQTEVVFLTNVFCLNLIYQLLGKEAVRCRLCLLEDRQLPVYQAHKRPETMHELAQQANQRLLWQAQVGFSLDVGLGYVSGGTVVYIALQIAAQLGYRRVFLAGVDMTRFHEPRFYEQAHNRLDTKLDAEFATLVYPSFCLASQACEQLGIQVYNLCLDSGLDDAVFPRVRLDEVL